MTELSVVLISKNQDWNIERLVESVLREKHRHDMKEIVLVDSASTDRTTEKAACYPIEVLKLRPDQRLTAAAGRYVGYKRTTGDLVLFLDGDMELCEGWLDQALDVMHSRSEVAVICGQVIDRPKTMHPSGDERSELPGTEAAGVLVKQSGGAAMYRRSVLESVGTFNPFLYADEEPELCLRIRYAGHRVLQLLRPIAFHYSVPFYSWSTFLAKRKHHFFLGFGQNIRYFLGTPLLWSYLRERGWGIPPAIVLCIGIVAAGASILNGQWAWVMLWCAFVTFLTLGIAIRKRSLARALITFFGRLLILEGSIRGFFLKPYNPAIYPGRFERIR